jgi:hypothetical protein
VAIYIVISKPKRISVKLGVVHCIVDPPVMTVVASLARLTDAFVTQPGDAGANGSRKRHAMRAVTPANSTAGRQKALQAGTVTKTQQSVPSAWRGFANGTVDKGLLSLVQVNREFLSESREPTLHSQQANTTARRAPSSERPLISTVEETE